MKPSKKKNCEIKKGVSASTSNPKINTYFKAVARQFELNVEEKIGSDEASIRDTYIDALKKKLESKFVFELKFRSNLKIVDLSAVPI